MTQNDLNQLWGGREFYCRITGEIKRIPPEVVLGQVYRIGDCYVKITEDVKPVTAGPIEEGMLLENGNWVIISEPIY